MWLHVFEVEQCFEHYIILVCYYNYIHNYTWLIIKDI